jgi:hypothetical protein
MNEAFNIPIICALVGLSFMVIGLAINNWILRRRLNEIYYPIANYDAYFSEIVGNQASPADCFRAACQTLMYIRNNSTGDRLAMEKYRQIRDENLLIVRGFNSSIINHNPEAGQ